MQEFHQPFLIITIPPPPPPCLVIFSDPDSHLYEYHVAAGRTPRDKSLYDWEVLALAQQLFINFKIPNGIPCWVIVRAVNNGNYEAFFIYTCTSETSSCNLQFFSELITTQLRISHGVTANSLYLICTSLLFVICTFLSALKP